MKDQELWELFCTIVHRLRPLDSHVLARSDLTMPQMRVLFTIAYNGKQAITTIADMLDVKVPNITYILDNLEDKELVERKRSEHDRRIVLACLTKEGHELTDEIMQTKTGHFNDALSKLAGRDRRALQRGLQALDSAFESSEVGE